MAAVRSGELLGVFMTGSLSPREAFGLQAVHTHVFTSMGPWLRRTDTPRCLAHRFKRDLTLPDKEQLLLSSPMSRAAAAMPSAAAGPGVDLGLVVSLLALFFIVP